MHGHRKSPCAGNPLESGKEWRGALEGRSETWLGDYHTQRCAYPTISPVQGWSEPRVREGLQACGNQVVDRRRARNHEHEQKREQEERDHSAHPCKQERLIVREAYYKQPEQSL